MSGYIYQNKDWPNFKWDNGRVMNLLATVRNKQGRLLGNMEALGFNLRSEAMLQTLTLNIIKSSEIEGEKLNAEQVRSSVARRLGITIAGLTPSDRNVEGVVEMMLDATQNFDQPLTKERLFDWHASLFPTGRSCMHKIITGDWRDNSRGPMQVVSGISGNEKIHFEAPGSNLIPAEMEQFISWVNSTTAIDPVIKAAIAHLWFITIHPFEDGNGRIARAIADLLLAAADNSSQRFYSMSAQIQKERNIYYLILEESQKGDMDISGWLEWFLNCLDRALSSTESILAAVLTKARFWEKFSGQQLNTRQHSMLNKMLDGFDGKLTSSKWAKISKCSQDTALRDIQELIDARILIKEMAGGRNTSYSIIIT
jgi:Fic family protein